MKERFEIVLHQSPYERIKATITLSKVLNPILLLILSLFITLVNRYSVLQIFITAPIAIACLVYASVSGWKLHQNTKRKSQIQQWKANITAREPYEIIVETIEIISVYENGSVNTYYDLKGRLSKEEIPFKIDDVVREQNSGKNNRIIITYNIIGDRLIDADCMPWSEKYTLMDKPKIVLVISDQTLELPVEKVSKGILRPNDWNR